MAEGRATITLAISLDQKKALKIMAAEKNMTVSGMVSEWIDDKYEKYKKKTKR